MTTIYMICNAECEDLQDASSEFTQKGEQEVNLIQSFFEGKAVDEVYLSAQPNAAKTIMFLTKQEKLPMHVAEEFNERKIGPRVANMNSFTKRQWEEPEYKLPGGESFLELQDRVIDGLEKVVTSSKNQVNVIASHRMVIGSIIQFFDDTFTYEEYLRTIELQPWIVKMEFEEKTLIGLEEIRCV